MAAAFGVVSQVQAGGGQPVLHHAMHSAMNTIGNISNSVLKYLKAIADGSSPLDQKQLSELHVFILKNPQAEAVAVDATQRSKNLDLHALLRYMTSSECNIMRPLLENDLTHPIPSYFISSSHNTYLTGNQLYGEASTDAYSNVLLRGCRCIEIDVWDGEAKAWNNDDREEEEKHHFTSHFHRSLSSHLSKHGKKEDVAPAVTAADDPLQMPTPWVSATTVMRAEPRVLHGYTMTKEVSFRAVCSAIRDSAFVTSDLPLVVSLEVHTSPEQQEVMVDIMRNFWRGLLVEEASQDCTVLPSPAELRGKILVKVKGRSSNAIKGTGSPSLKQTRSASPVSGSEDEETSTASTAKPKAKKKSIIQALCALGVYTHSYHFSSLSGPEARIPSHVFSLSERRLIEVHESQGPTLFSHNRNFLMRAFPSGTRVSSSNLDPAFFWRKGVQMVALNWQSWDAGMMLNEGMFGGSSGWILKPEGYRRSAANAPISQYENQTGAMPHKTLKLTIQILAAQELPLPIGDARSDHFHPYVKCELHVEKPEERSGGPIAGGGRSQGGEYKRCTRPSKGIEPDFGGEMMQFVGVTGVVEELSFVRSVNLIYSPDTRVAYIRRRVPGLRATFSFEVPIELHVRLSSELLSSGLTRAGPLQRARE
ncbi:hypothetical protein MMC18_003405 [Xylographa bjoerkii]|nr:hypothetical protein [Xylographa bjoerkii]